jgi:hypothetical protein
MTYSSPAERAEIIGGFRALADYLESSPEVPVPSYSVVYIFPPDGNWQEMRGEIRAIAARLGVIARETAGGHYTAVRMFGPVEYRAVAIPPRSNSSKQGE